MRSAVTTYLNIRSVKLWTLGNSKVTMREPWSFLSRKTKEKKGKENCYLGWRTHTKRVRLARNRRARGIAERNWVGTKLPWTPLRRFRLAQRSHPYRHWNLLHFFYKKAQSTSSNRATYLHSAFSQENTRSGSCRSTAMQKNGEKEKPTEALNSWNLKEET